MEKEYQINLKESDILDILENIVLIHDFAESENNYILNERIKRIMKKLFNKSNLSEKDVDRILADIQHFIKGNILTTWELF